MKNWLRIVAGVTAIACGALLSGCAWLGFGENERPADITVEELLALRRQAADPSGEFERADSFIQRQVVTWPRFLADDEKFLLETRFLKPEHFQLTTLHENRPAAAVLFNSGKAWRVDYINRTVTQIEEPELSVLRTVFIFGVPDGDLASVFETLELTLCTVDDEDLYKLRCVPKAAEAPAFDLYIDSATYLTRMISTTARNNDADIQYVAVIDRYGNYGDVMIPDRSTIFQAGRKEQTQVVQFELNVKLNEADFLPPKF